MTLNEIVAAILEPRKPGISTLDWARQILVMYEQLPATEWDEQSIDEYQRLRDKVAKLEKGP